MADNLRKKTASGFVFKFAERAGAQGIRFIIQLLLARLLLPEEFGIIALVSVFIEICDVFVTYGFGNSLIANKDSDSADFSTCFYFGLLLSLVVYIIVFSASPFIASFYNNSELTPVVRVMALRIPVAAFNTVQQAYVAKNMWFKKFFYATLIGTVVSGVVAIIMAYMGFGIWALVEQYLGNVMMDTVCLWVIVGWRPTLEFSFTKLKAIYSYGWKILVVGLIDMVYSKLRSLVIGKKYSSEDLAFYTRGYLFPSFGMRLIEPTVNSVLFPALSQCRDDQLEMKNITKHVVLVSTYLLYPFMIGLAVIAKPLVVLLLTEKWLPCVVYLQIGCIANLFRPQQFINNSIIKASGRSDLLLKLDIVKKIIGVILLLISMQFGVLWIAWSLVAIYFISMIINIAPNRKILNYGYREQFSDVFKNMFPALIMGAGTYLISYLKIDYFLMIVVQIIIGVLIYLGLSIVLKNKSFELTIRFVRQYVFRK